MASQLKEFLAPNIIVDDIIIFKDENETEEQNINAAERIGYNLPIMKINNFVVERGMIENCTLTIGNDLLPELYLTINDDKFRLREILTSERLSIVANFGTTRDPYYIKQEFILNNINGMATSPIIYVSGYLYVPELFESEIISYKDKTSFQVIMEICKKCNLGLLSNIEDSNDTQTWINDNKPNILFLNKILSHSYINDNTYLECFIDQYNYLNIIDVKKSFENTETEKSQINPIDGTQLEQQVDVKLSSSQFDENNIFKIHSWNLNLDYGSTTKNIPTKINRNIIDVDTNEPVLSKSEVNIFEELLKQHEYQIPQFESIHNNYLTSKRERGFINTYLKQGDSIIAQMFTPVMLLYPYQYVPTELFINGRRKDAENQEAANLEQIWNETTTTAEPLEFKDELHSGDYIIRSIKLSIEDQNNIFTQSIVLQRLIKEQ